MEQFIVFRKGDRSRPRGGFVFNKYSLACAFANDYYSDIGGYYILRSVDGRICERCVPETDIKKIVISIATDLLPYAKKGERRGDDDIRNIFALVLRSLRGKKVPEKIIQELGEKIHQLFPIGVSGWDLLNLSALYVLRAMSALANNNKRQAERNLSSFVGRADSIAPTLIAWGKQK